LMAEYDQRLLDLQDELRDRYPTVPTMKHGGVPLGALERDDLVRLMAMLLDEWKEMRAKELAHSKQREGRGRR